MSTALAISEKKVIIYFVPERVKKDGFVKITVTNYGPGEANINGMKVTPNTSAIGMFPASETIAAWSEPRSNTAIQFEIEWA